MTFAASATPKYAVDDDARAEFLSALGSKGVIALEDAAPMLEEWRGRWRGAPGLVIAPGSTEETAAAVRICAARGLAITPQGGNTGLVGGQIPANGEVLLSLKRMTAVRDVSPLDNAMTVEAGLTLVAAQEEAAKVDRLFPLSIGAEGSCQVGGIISTNAGGVNVLRYGNTRDLVLGLEVVTPAGEIWHGLKRLRKDNTGYDLKQLFIGGEGTLGIVTAAALKLFPRPREKTTVFAALPDPYAAVSLLARAQEISGGQTTSFELIGRFGFSLVLKHIPGARDPLEAPAPWYALIEFSSGLEGALAPMAEQFLADAFEAGEVADATIAANETQGEALWRMRHAMSEAMKPEGNQAKFDVSTPIAQVPDFLREADAAVEGACPGARIVAFGHMGDGNMHYDIVAPEGVDGPTFEARWPTIEKAVYDVIGRFEGSISAEHGVGVARREEIAERKPAPEMAMMRAVKAALDPQGIMNPGKML